jgi:alkaline phosphatase D
VNRRTFLGRIAALAAASQLPACVQAAPLRFDKDPFTLGVASGDPLPDGVVLWTRLAPDPLHGGGMGATSVDVAWEVARDEGMKDVARSGVASASADLAHSVHVEVSGLEADRGYWYRFRAGGAESPIGRTRTAPPAGATPQRFRFAFASCQNYAQGYYTAHASLAREDLDAVVFLGDYIYEGTARGNVVRDYAKSGWSYTLADYRDRYAQYKSDRDLQAAHAAFPWIVTWDDHEVENNYAGGIPRNDVYKAALLERAAAYQAYYEHLPLRGPRPQGPDLRLYRALSFGDLVTFHVLDTRQYRSPEVSLCREQDETASGYCPASVDPSRTMLGADQRGWLLAGLAGSGAQWNVVAQSVRFAQQDSNPDPARHTFDGVDNWMGYVADRQAILEQFTRTRNPVVISGDSHVNFVYDLRRDFADPRSPIVGTELLGTSISSEGDSSPVSTQFDPSPAKNPQLRFFDNHRGYVRCTVERTRVTADFRAVSTVLQPTATASTTASFAIVDGRPGAQRA